MVEVADVKGSLYIPGSVGAPWTVSGVGTDDGEVVSCIGYR